MNSTNTDQDFLWLLGETQALLDDGKLAEAESVAKKLVLSISERSSALFALAAYRQLANIVDQLDRVDEAEALRTIADTYQRDMADINSRQKTG